MEELPEEAIAEAEQVEVAHSHEGVSAEDGSLVAHLQSCHQLEVDPGLSATTQEGLHDRLHDETHASED